MKNIIRIGHRGACGYEPENTLLSFRKAIELKVDMVEVDVRICGSGEPVAIHDDTLDRTTNGTGRVSEKTLEELRSLDAGKGQYVPALREVFDAVSRNAAINIELKDRNAVKPVAGLINEYVRKGWSYSDFLVSSFDHLQLKAVKELNPEIRIGALIAAEVPEFAAFAKEMGAYSVHSNGSAVTSAFMHEVHARSILVFVYTRNDAGSIATLKSAGVDGIFSDYPDRI